MENSKNNPIFTIFYTSMLTIVVFPTPCCVVAMGNYIVSTEMPSSFRWKFCANFVVIVLRACCFYRRLYCFAFDLWVLLNFFISKKCLLWYCYELDKWHFNLSLHCVDHSRFSYYILWTALKRNWGLRSSEFYANLYAKVTCTSFQNLFHLTSNWQLSVMVFFTYRDLGELGNLRKPQGSVITVLLKSMT